MTKSSCGGASGKESASCLSRMGLTFFNPEFLSANFALIDGRGPIPRKDFTPKFSRTNNLLCYDSVESYFPTALKPQPIKRFYTS